MRRLISRMEAAELLNCTQQTISNWVATGVLQGHTKNGKLFVDSKTLLQMLDTAEEVVRSEGRMKALLEDLQTSQEVLQKAVRRKAIELGLWGHSVMANLTRQMIFTVLQTHLTRLAPLDRQVLGDVINNPDLTEVGNKYCLTERRVIQIAHRALVRLGQLTPYDELVKENDALKGRIAELYEKMGKMGEKVELYEKMRPLLEKKIYDTEMSTRLKNILLFNEIFTVEDLVNCTSGLSKMAKMRNMGVVSLKELERFMQDNGLTFGMFKKGE